MPSIRSGAVVAIVLGVSTAMAAPSIPKPGYYHPSSLQVGTKTRVVMGGDAVGGVQGAWVTGEGVKVTRIVPVPGQPRAPGKTQRAWVMNWLYDILEDKPIIKKEPHRPLPPEALLENTDWQECNWWHFLDDHDHLQLETVARFMFTPENYPQATPALDRLLLLDVEVDPNAQPGRRDIILYDGRGASAPHPFYITREPHVAEPFFVIPPREMYAKRPSPVVSLHLSPGIKPQALPIHIDGQIWPGEVDKYVLRLEEGQDLVCSMIGRELFPYLGDAVPGFFNPVLSLCDANDHEVAFADDFYYLPDPVLTYKVPMDGFYTLKVYDNLFRGGPNFVYTVFCRDAKTDRPVYTPKERAFECYPQPAAFIPPKPGPDNDVRKGTIDIPGRVDRHFIDIKDPGTWHFELYARREGAPLDGVMRLYGPMGNLPLSVAPLLKEWDDNPGRLYEVKNVGSDDLPIIKTNMLYEGSIPQAECDPSGTWTFKTPGRYCVTVSDRAGLGGEHYDYTLCISPARPSFEVFSLISACCVNGGSAQFTACVLRKDGFDGTITFDSTDEYEVSGEFAGDELETEVTVRFKKTWSGLKRFDLWATGELPDGKKLRVRVTPTDPGEQAFAYSHLLPAHGFYFGVPGENIRVKDTRGPQLGAKKKTSHSNGQSCTTCHQKDKKHTKGKSCKECHTKKD